MTQTNAQRNINDESSQAFGQLSCDSKVVTPAIFAILPDGTVLEDAEVETAQDSIAGSLRDITGSLIDIAESLNALPDYADQFDRALELWEETNRHLGNIEENLKASADENRSLPHGQGNRKARIREEVSPGAKRLRRIEREGGRQP